LGARGASALSPLGAAGSPDLLRDARGSAADHLAVFGNASPGSRPVWYWPRHEPGEGLVHSSSRRPEVTGEVDSGWAAEGELKISNCGAYRRV